TLSQCKRLLCRVEGSPCPGPGRLPGLLSARPSGTTVEPLSGQIADRGRTETNSGKREREREASRSLWRGDPWISSPPSRRSGSHEAPVRRVSPGPSSRPVALSSTGQETPWVPSALRTKAEPVGQRSVGASSLRRGHCTSCRRCTSPWSTALAFRPSRSQLPEGRHTPLGDGGGDRGSAASSGPPIMVACRRQLGDRVTSRPGCPVGAGEGFHPAEIPRNIEQQRVNDERQRTQCRRSGCVCAGRSHVVHSLTRKRAEVQILV